LDRKSGQGYQASAGCDDDAHCQPLLFLHAIIPKKPSRSQALSLPTGRQAVSRPAITRRVYAHAFSADGDEATARAIEAAMGAKA
jgi:hypothetical protein